MRSCPKGRNQILGCGSLAALSLGLILVALVALAAPVRAAPSLQTGAPGAQGGQIFQAKCSSCHTIGKGKLVGPDLKDVTQRRDAQWLRSFISDPSKMFASNDPTALQLLRENNDLKMPTLLLSAADVDALVGYLQSGTTPAAAPTVGARGTITVTGSVAAGQRLLTGELALQGGGPACIGCHTVLGTGSLGGGALGPDLTHVAQRYGEAGLAAALTNIAFPTMVGPFTDRPLTAQEGADLVAYFKQMDQQQPAVPVFSPGALTADTWHVLSFGLAGTAVLFAVLALFWPRQRRSVSERLRSGDAARKG